MKRRAAPKTMVLLLAVTLAACRGASGPAPGAHAQEPAARVRVALVQRAAGDGLVPVPGVVAARDSATLAARIPASVVALPFREGDPVARGAVVVRLDAAALHSADAAAEAGLSAAEADLARIRVLVSRNAATPREMEEAASRAAAARAVLSGARDSLAYAVLRAPFDGVVAARPVHVGDVVSPGTPLITIEGRGGLEVRATVGAAAAAPVRPGQRLSALVDGQAAALPALVRSVSPAADPATHRVEVRADLEAAPGLRSGLFVRLLVPDPGGPPRLTVPSSAVLERGGLSGVFVVDGDRARLRWVAVGEAEGDALEVRAGLEPGATVVLEPAELADGQRIEVVR
ncbi:MAG TPA: efflux RND transporter periplasmic adaptor subunit [Vicinamibacteria bacterium]|jgi:RND family efflux transporter MFP subunit